MNCPKHVEFYSQNKFEKLVHVVGFIIRIYHDAWPPEPENHVFYLDCICIRVLMNSLMYNTNIQV